MGKLYHITNVKNVGSILDKGLMANEDGDIYLFDNVSVMWIDGSMICVADHIAKNQIFTDRYAMFEIDTKGIKYPIEQDLCAEWTTKQQYIVKQKVINKKYINLFGIYEV